MRAPHAIGGTWDLFRYPGIRSDSDMYTFGYRFRPWIGRKALADGPSILSYVRDTAREAGIDQKIRFGHRVHRAEWSSAACRWTVHAMMLSEVPNAAFTVGYTHSSWTLKSDLASEYVCRLLNHMDAHGYDVLVPRDDDPSVQRTPLIDFGAGYVKRAIDRLPGQGSTFPWRLRMNYLADVVSLRFGRLDDGVMAFHRRDTAARR